MQHSNVWRKYRQGIISTAELDGIALPNRVLRVRVWQVPILSPQGVRERAPLRADYLELRRHLSLSHVAKCAGCMID